MCPCLKPHGRQARKIGGIDTYLLISFGPAPELHAILHEMERTLNLPELYVVVRTEVVPLLTECYDLSHEKAMQRMVLDPTKFQPITPDDVVRLSLADLDVIQRLYPDGEPNGEAPDWFLPEMLTEEGVLRHTRSLGGSGDRGHPCRDHT